MTPGTVLLWGLREDETFRAVHDAVRTMGASLAFVNHAAVDRTTVRFSTAPGAGHELICDGWPLRLRDVRAAYLRPYDWRDYELADSPQARRRATLVHQLVSDWAEHGEATIVNRPSAEATNHSKLLQAAHACACGFATPDSIVTNDPAELLAFHARHGEVVTKSLSSVRSVVRAFSPAELAGKRDGIGPAFVQQRIHGRAVRVHVVGKRTFACAIASDGIDYRYAPSTIEPLALPRDVAARCVALTRRLGLLLSGIDLIHTPAGEWHCLEANPNPGFSAFDPGQTREIAHALALALTGGA